MKKLKLLFISLLAVFTLSNAFAGLFEDMYQAIEIEDASWVKEILSDDQYNINEEQMWVDSAVFTAIDVGNYEIFELILNHKKLEINYTDILNTDNPLTFAISISRIRIAAAIINHSDIDLKHRNDDGDDALYLAKKNNLNGIVKLINNKLQVITQESHRFLGLCRAGNNLDAIRLALKSKNVEINYKSSTGVSPLIGATIEGKDKVLEILLKHVDLDVNIKDPGNWTALMYAAYYGHLEIAKQLLKHQDIDVNNIGKGGSTALQQAANRGNNDIARLILAHSGLN